MGRGRKGTGVEPRDNSIRVNFTWQEARCRETLKVNGVPILPTPPNIAYATRLMVQVNQRIATNTFVYGDFFPDSPRAAKPADKEAAPTLAAAGATWLQSKGRLAAATRSQYENDLTFWYGILGRDTIITELKHSDVAAKIGAHPWPSNKRHNNALIPLRGMFALHGRDLPEMVNPTVGVENAQVQKNPPDPFELDEAEAIIERMFKDFPPQLGLYFEEAFFTGLRPEEEIALMWDDCDWRRQYARIQRSKTFKGTIGPIKTYQVRDLELNFRALGALQRMKEFTLLKPAGYVFEHPDLCQPWHDERAQRDTFWKPVLKRLGIRYRRPYNTRHTYATMCLMAGAAPAWVARQLGHKNSKMLHEVYAKWIDGADKGREKAKLEEVLRRPMIVGDNSGDKLAGLA